MANRVQMAGNHKDCHNKLNIFSQLLQLIQCVHQNDLKNTYRTVLQHKKK